MNPTLRHAAAHCFVESLDAPVLAADDEHHLARVLRITANDAITVSNGAGAWAPARFTAVGGVVLQGDVVHEPPLADTTIACAIPKGDRPEWIVQKLTEIGVARIVLFTAARSVVRWDAERTRKNVERLQRVAREASMQSRRVYLPVVEVLAWSDVARLEGLAIAEPGATGRIDTTVRVVAVGPEGGFDPSELAAGIPTVTLSEQVLRVETAALAGGLELLLARR
ncbi:MAG: RsmE family RNA methyltransferase [Actinomycetota bacterium]